MIGSVDLAALREPVQCRLARVSRKDLRMAHHDGCGRRPSAHPTRLLASDRGMGY